MATAWTFPGERIISCAAEHLVSNLGPGICCLYVTNARLIAFRAQQFGPALFTATSGATSLEEYYTIIELDEVRDFAVKDRAGLTDYMFRGGNPGGIEITLRDGMRYHLSAEGQTRVALMDALRTAQAARIPLVRLGDSQEAILFKSRSMGGPPMAGPLSGIWRRTFAFGSHWLSAAAKLCLTNRRILFYRVENLAQAPQLGLNTLSYGYAAPLVKWIQIPLDGVQKVTVRRSFAPLGRMIVLPLQAPPVGVIPARRTLVIGSMEDVLSPHYAGQVILDEGLQKKLDAGRDVSFALLHSDQFGRDGQDAFECVLAQLRELLSHRGA